jgi:hypothetical protein
MFKLFGSKNLSNLIDEIKNQIKSYIDVKEENYLLSVNEQDYINYLYEEHKINKIYIDFEDIKLSDYEKKIIIIPERDRISQVVVYQLPIKGNQSLLNYRPDIKYIDHFPDVYIEGNYLGFEIEVLTKDSNDVKREAGSVLNTIKKQSNFINDEVNTFNNELKGYIKDVVSSRKKRIFDNRKFLEALNVPIKENKNIKDTFEVDVIKDKKIEIEEPVIKEKKFSPEPRISKEIYQSILKTIFDLGKNFERYPSSYKDKDEEGLRDLILIFLQTRFDTAAATGESFNKKGKTDILLRYKISNLFIAECKVWNGEEEYLKGVSQLLGYLTWRDSKAAMIVFVDRKNFTSIIGKVKEATQKHSNYLGFVSETSESWINYRYHINGDRNREVKLGVLLFNIY